MKTKRVYGSWPSSISTDMVIKGTPKLQETTVDEGRVFWLQTLPEEKGRVSIMRYDGNQIQSILPRPLSAKSKVHEYGGGSYLIDANRIYFVLADDQRVYSADIESAENSIAFNPSPLIPENDERQLRFADLCLDKRHNRLVAVCEEHKSTAREPANYLATIDLDGSTGTRTLIEGCDFYASPKISPCGKWLCWLSWNHPDMPWDATQLWVAELKDGGEPGTPLLVAGNGNESIFQPNWSPDGELFFVSDRNNWWNIYRCPVPNAEVTQVTSLEAEFATPQWVFNMSTYAFLNAKSIIATYYQSGQWYLSTLDISDPANTEIENIDVGVTSIDGISAADNRAAFIGASEKSLPAVYRFDGAFRSCTAINPLPLEIRDEDISAPCAITFTTTHNQEAYGYFYPPMNSRYHDDGALPPLIVTCHGGPTGATDNNLNLKVQHWTNRGFAVLDVNYRGSTGYGRQYRQLLYKNWGIYDVDDVCTAAEYAVAQGWADPDRLIIKGSSAGGYTVLAALTFRDTFKAGVSLYGIGDLNTLVQDTHKFEAKCLDRLVGDYERDRDIYEQRSPIKHTEKLNCPLLVFQGLEDKVVPPNQAIKMVNAVKQKGLPVAYVEYADEAHGFRNSLNVAHMLKAEQYFYGRIFDIPLPEELENFIPIFNL